VLLADAGMTAAAVLAAVLAWAGAAKLQRAEATREGFAALGLPRPDLAARAVPVAELLVAVLLLAVPPVGAVLALLLLGAFTWVVVQQVRAGSEVPCACFGQPHAPPLSWTEVVRNGILAVFGLLAVFAGGAHVPGPRGLLVSTGLVLIALGVLSHLHASAASS
jgi:uncharacterized membrane protein YphA (DoxX/SURF4 family)